ncbi:unnamed protein product [Thelazia callipaeda]|uniref:SAM domain-containing protein n=1 Tax=Thelazia callipaeda TaxID=103827 RepID=A0A0N5D8G9_THECL|nr:unnamed protein product [Thelazia callipaeda]
MNSSGCDNQESPSASSVHSSISPPISLMQDITTATSATSITSQQISTTTIPITLSQMCTPSATPIGGHQILVDPATGQHFLLSSAPAPPPPPTPHPHIIYQPVYYSATPAQPVYYHAFPSGTHGAYVVAATPISGTQSGIQMTPSHMTLGQRFSSSPPAMSTAQSTVGGFTRGVADFDDTRSVVTTDERHTAFQSSLGPAARNMSRAIDLKQIINSKTSTSLPLSASNTKNCSVFDNSTTVVVSSNNSQKTPTQMHPQENITYQQMNNKQALVTDVTGHAVPEEGERTPLFGAAPSWWGEDGTSSQQVQNDSDNIKLPNLEISNSSKVAVPIISYHPSLSDTEVLKINRLKVDGVTKTTDSTHRPLKSIRMDIDLSEPFIDEEIKKEEKTKVTSRASCGTAFTVSFDNEEGSPKANISLQDAAKKTSSRRFMRRSMPRAGMVPKGTAAKIAGLTAASSDPKQYLLNKMLMGVAEEGCEGNDLMQSSTREEGKLDTDDTLSEAGTYIVEDGDRPSKLIVPQTIKDSDAESVSSESTSTESTDNSHSVASARMGQVLPQISENVVTVEDTKDKNENLLRELLRMSSERVGHCRGMSERHVAPSTPCRSGSSRLSTASGIRARVQHRSDNSGSEERHYSSHRLCTVESSSRTPISSVVRRAQPVAGASCTNENNFRRGDGGRFSMRFSGLTAKVQPASTASSRNDRPPFRVGGIGSRSQVNGGSVSVHKESAEMTAWLRRKDYNPMKAAAEAKKLQQLKARADKFVSNRSVSFHQGAKPFATFSPTVRSLNDPRHNRSQDDLSVDEAICGPETILASYSKGITRDLNKLRSAEVEQDKTQVIGLENAVQQLTMKCNRSIELIRNSHQGHLSDSVENLLEIAIKPVKDCTGTVTDQLDRLSAAFDAIQKYLEISSASLPASPSGSSPTASVTALSSTSPSRRPCSAYQSKLAAAKRSPSGGQKIV